MSDSSGTYDFVVLGGGSAGYAAARTAVELGLKTAVVDGAEELGGLCILRGCMPSKTLIESANRNLSLRRAEEFGLRASELEVRADEIIARKRKLIGEFSSYRQEQLQEGDFDLIRGHATFEDSHQIRVDLRNGDTRSIHAESTLIATGSKHLIPDVPGLSESRFLTSDDVLDLEELPESIIVLGGGPIALEMAHYFEGLGTKVTLIQRSSHVLSNMDDDVSSVVEEAYRERGMDVYCGTDLIRVSSDDAIRTVEFRHGEVEKKVTAPALLVALGRSPATDRLDLEAAGVEHRRGRVLTTEQQATSQPHIFAAGDVSGPLEVVHLAIEQGEAAARNAAICLGKLSERPTKMDYRLKLFGVFSEPQVAAVGVSEKELREDGVEFRSASYPFDDHGKSMVKGETHGFVKLIADVKTGQLLGGAVVGPEAVDLIHEIVVAMYFEATATQLARIPHYHPTLSEIWTYPAEELA